MLRLPRFGVVTPSSVDEVLALLSEHGKDARLLAGGTDLVPNLKHRIEEPKLLISLVRLSQLSGIRCLDDGGLENVQAKGATLDDVSDAIVQDVG